MDIQIKTNEKLESLARKVIEMFTEQGLTYEEAWFTKLIIENRLTEAQERTYKKATLDQLDFKFRDQHNP